MIDPMSTTTRRIGLLLALGAAASLLGCASTAPAQEATKDAAPQTHEIVQSADADAPLDVVWDSWTTASGLQTFFAPEAEIEASVPGRFALRPAAGDGAPILAGSVVGLEPQASMILEPSASTRVAVRFVQLEDGRTRVTVVQASQGPPSAQEPGVALAEAAWSATLSRMARRFAEGPIDWSQEQAPVVSASR